jgi:uncharacterized protein YceH (UPF0502 family)
MPPSLYKGRRAKVQEEAMAQEPLPMHERRVLGVLVEKAKTTPDTYPLSLNALTTGCNQKSNRDPMLDMTDADVEDALMSCQKKGLAIKITGGRVERWRHNLYDGWHVDKVELAVLAELLLRGPQTEGELRGRASRMEPIDELETLRGVLRKLAERNLVAYLTPEGRRGSVVTHGFHEPAELQQLKKQGFGGESGDAPEPRAAPERTPPQRDGRLDEVVNQLSQLHQQFAQLAMTVEQLTSRVQQLENRS